MSTKAGKSSRAIAGTALALGVGLFAFIGVRVKETLADRRTMAATLQTQVKDGPKRTAALGLVHGKPMRFRSVIPVTGTLAPIQDSDVGFKAGGRLSAVRVKVGDRVKAGQALGALDVSEASAQAAATSAGVRAAEVALEMAKDAERRTGALFGSGATSEFEQTAAKQRTAMAAAQLEQARAQARLAAVGVGNGSLGAPFAGLVTRAPNGIGKIVGPGEALFRLEDTSVLKLGATVSEGDARLIEIGAEAAIEGGPRGKITAVLGSLDAATRRVPIVAEIPNDAVVPLLAGSFVRVTVTGSREIEALSFPASALRPGSQDELVVFDNGKARIARIVFTTSPDGSLAVQRGVTAADAVLERPSSEVHDGDALAAPAEAAPAPAP